MNLPGSKSARTATERGLQRDLPRVQSSSVIK